MPYTISIGISVILLLLSLIFRLAGETPAYTATGLLPADRHGLKSVGSRTRNTGFCHPLCASCLFRHKLASFPEKCHP